MRLTFLLLLFGFAASGQQSEKIIVDNKAKQFTDSAAKFIMHYWQNNDLKKAILLLNKAIEIDSNYINAYTLKLSLQMNLKQYNNALKTALQINRLRPNSPSSYVTPGILNEKLGNTISSHYYFTTAIKKYDNILDTMSTKNKYYYVHLLNKAIDLILAGQQVNGNVILKQLYNKESNSLNKENIQHYMNKSRKEILDDIFNPKSTDQIKVTRNN